jgi:DNA polymerase-3 subunit gamma/tau
MFVLATTDAGDLPPTIHSRCQRFDFHPLGVATTIAHLKRISEAEGIKVEEEALRMVANASRGAMRDAQMLLEQSAAFGTGEVTAATVRELLGLVEREWVERFLTVLKERDVKGGLDLLGELIESGRDPSELLGEVELELRDALMARLGSDVAPMSASRLLSAPERSNWFGEEELVALIAHVRRASEELASRRAGHPRIGAELAVARLMRRERALSWGEVESVLSRIETGLGSAPGRPAGSAPAGAPPAPTVPRPAPSGPAPSRPAPSRPAPSRPAPSASPSQGASVQRPPAASGPSAAELAGLWPGLMEKLKTEHPGVHAYLMKARPVGFENGALVLEIASDFHRDGLSAGGGMKAGAEGFLSAEMGRPIRLAVRVPAAAPRPAAPSTAPGVAPVPRPDWIEREPLVKTALDMFKARIVPQKNAEGERK